jgi:hypothetical protein
VSIRRRLEALEGGRGGPCPECGWRPDDVPPVEVVLDGAGEAGSVLCGGCGRWLVIVWPEHPVRTASGGGGAT